jgi:hypothetical protein
VPSFRQRGHGALKICVYAIFGAVWYRLAVHCIDLGIESRRMPCGFVRRVTLIFWHGICYRDNLGHFMTHFSSLLAGVI